MGLWKRLVAKIRKKGGKDKDWDQIVYRHEDVDFHDEEERSRYLTGCMEQIADAQREIILLSGEYALVTEYLTDMEEIELLPAEESAEIKNLAGKLLTLEKDRERYRERSGRMPENEYRQIQVLEDEVEEGISKLKDVEKYQRAVKQDLSRLDGERNACRYRRGELNTLQANLRGMVAISVTALAACFVMLLILQFGFHMNTVIGYYVATAAAAIAITVAAVKYMDSDRELVRVKRAENRLIQLQNKVKIRYVNNTNLLDYLCMKYNVDGSRKLQKLWEQYLTEKDARREEAETEANLSYEKKELEKLLLRYRVKSPDRWLSQPGALVDPKEMVEIRHSLIIRRQTLRKQLEYNQDIAEKAQKEVRDIAAEYPEYAAEIAEMAERYEKEYS